MTDEAGATDKDWIERRSGALPTSDYRHPYLKDRARIIHSAAFRRLQAKTQVLGIGEGDFHRTRLTHSMEVAQVARGIVYFLKKIKSDKSDWIVWLPGQNLIEAISLAHDLGHPPFGHGGEVALNFGMRNFGGFEGNGQTLRLLARLEAHTESFGLDLTRRSLLGILKYPVQYDSIVRTELSQNQNSLQIRKSDWEPPKCYMGSEGDIVEWIIKPFSPADQAKFRELKKAADIKSHGKSRYHCFDTGFMDYADDISYGVHDLEDAITLQLIPVNSWRGTETHLDKEWASEHQLEFGKLTTDLFGDNSNSHKRKRAIGRLVDGFIKSTDVEKIDGFEHPLLAYQVTLSEPAAKFLNALKNLVFEKVIQSPQVQTLEYRGRLMVAKLFEAISSDPSKLMKENFATQWLGTIGESNKQRVICDYIAGMTDEYATRIYERLFVPREGHVSDRL